MRDVAAGGIDNRAKSNPRPSKTCPLFPFVSLFTHTNNMLTSKRRLRNNRLTLFLQMLRMNWVSSGLASLVLWTFVIWALSAGINAAEEVKGWQAWIPVNWTWLYDRHARRVVHFIIYLLFTKYKDVKLGRDDEEPAFSDYEWFSMLFACGIGIGLYTYGVAEPMWYYRMNYYNAQKIPITNDDQRAQQAIFLTLFHWGIHGWIPYVLVAITLRVVCYRPRRPMTIRRFLPAFG